MVSSVTFPAVFIEMNALGMKQFCYIPLISLPKINIPMNLIPPAVEPAQPPINMSKQYGLAEGRPKVKICMVPGSSYLKLPERMNLLATKNTRIGCHKRLIIIAIIAVRLWQVEP